ncbi:hypothetical protein KA478_02895 [Patescibacteria group bacterium]|nr:hypothetical protein [Patescibacteria group bacterium]
MHGLATGRWAMDQLFNWERMTQDEKQTNSYEKLSPVEKEPYEKFG